MEEQIKLCQEWLDLQKNTKNVNTTISSYGYKHIIEQWAGVYISKMLLLKL